jgi:SAM-dependent methyltransferase
MCKKNPLLKNCQLGKHIDLGCGSKPRNPYSFSELYGCDIRSPLDFKAHADFTYAQANLTIEKIPFPDNFFNSLSAYDFIEHIPRQFPGADGKIILPFINLMDEIHRVLIPGGIFVAATPAFPKAEAFQDPTHVNIITKNTHEYFVGDIPKAFIYGFKGRFSKKQVKWGVPKNGHQITEPSWRQSYRNLEHLLFKSGRTHLIWELIAEK